MIQQVPAVCYAWGFKFSIYLVNCCQVTSNTELNISALALVKWLTTSFCIAGVCSHAKSLLFNRTFTNINIGFPFLILLSVSVFLWCCLKILFFYIHMDSLLYGSSFKICTFLPFCCVNIFSFLQELPHFFFSKGILKISKLIMLIYLHKVLWISLFEDYKFDILFCFIFLLYWNNLCLVMFLIVNLNICI